MYILAGPDRVLLLLLFLAFGDLKLTPLTSEQVYTSVSTFSTALSKTNSVQLPDLESYILQTPLYIVLYYGLALKVLGELLFKRDLIGDMS